MEAAAIRDLSEASVYDGELYLEHVLDEWVLDEWPSVHNGVP